MSSYLYSKLLLGFPFSLSGPPPSITHVSTSLDHSGNQSHMPSSKGISSAPYAKKRLHIASLSSINSSSPIPFPAKGLFHPENWKQNWVRNLKESWTSRSVFQNRLDKKEGWKEGVRRVKPGPSWIRGSLTGIRKGTFGGVGLGKGM